ncbi:DUF2681 domain-containing protein [Pasteurellaceae bacterium HPA106]|uniref:DUF2681 domain-containing protein n=1 Tax=Spirabiliibacterium pneumoniae TaxID=221400 RepID=UPI001AACDD73|nr:DUF2681 domain-containing protein [Spirabiliibacterium pneumoniae]MBE2895470.1 DUF2681 domain-containing protein [Spirabiliibacterium pneumoniae]
MMWSLYALGAFGVTFVVGYLHARAQAKKIAQQRQEIEKVRSEKAVIAKELNNAEQRKQIDAASRRLSGNGVDDSLQSKGYFRDAP